MNAGALRHPAFSSVGPFAARLLHVRAWPSVAELGALFRDRLALPPAIELEPQEDVRRRGLRRLEDIYEVRIARHGKLPTREGSWHDLANLLVWCAFPRAKRALVARQYSIVRARVPDDVVGLPPARTREQDALAILDEGGVVLLHARGDAPDLGAPASVHAAIVDGRVVPRVFGHALLEAIARGELASRDLRGAAVLFGVDDPSAIGMETLDELLARHVADPDALRAPDPARSLWLAGVYASAER
jgi:hypothetical protein